MGFDRSVIFEGETTAVEPQPNTGRIAVVAMPRFAAGTLAHGRLELPELDALRIDDVVQIVHDFKGPLSTIALEAWLLDDKLGAAADGEVRRVVARINHNLAFLDRMVQDLLDSCAMDEGHFAIRRRPTELRGLLADAIERVVASRDRSRVVLEATGQVTLAIDDLRIERVVANLVANALKYGSLGTGVVVRLEADGVRVRVSVIDSGPGLSEAEMGYVFDRYRRTPSAQTIEGSGLGLYASKRIIEAHGGTLTVESVSGVGSRFYFELPAG